MKVSSLQTQLDSEQGTSTQLQARISELVEERENIVHNNSQLQIKIKVRRNFLSSVACRDVSFGGCSVTTDSCPVSAGSCRVKTVSCSVTTNGDPVSTDSCHATIVSCLSRLLVVLSLLTAVLSQVTVVLSQLSVVLSQLSVVTRQLTFCIIATVSCHVILDAFTPRQLEGDGHCV